MKGLLKLWQGLRPVLGLFLVLHLQSCAVTVYNWSEIPAENSHYGYSEEDKLEHYLHFAILNVDKNAPETAFTTWDQAPKLYSLHSYAPMIYRLAPQTDKYFLEAQNWDNYSRFSYVPLFFGWVGLLATSNEVSNLSGKPPGTVEKILENMLFSIIVIFASFGVSQFLAGKKQEEYEKIKAAYNDALRKELGLSEAQIQQLMQPQTEP